MRRFLKGLKESAVDKKIGKIDNKMYREVSLVSSNFYNLYFVLSDIPKRPLL